MSSAKGDNVDFKQHLSANKITLTKPAGNLTASELAHFETRIIYLFYLQILDVDQLDKLRTVCDQIMTISPPTRGIRWLPFRQLRSQA
jgi:hypothetical protein